MASLQDGKKREAEDGPSVRAVEKVWKSQPTLEGAGVRLRRAFGFQETPALDPFLLLDAFGSEDPEDYRRGFPWHPHRGIETITYLLDGEVEHGDSLGNRGTIGTGDVQWMTAGSGIIHQEMPKGDRKGRMAGFQLWANLPAAKKMMDPRYREVKSGEIPAVKTADGATVRVICGTVGDTRGPVKDIVTEPQLLDVSLPGGSAFVHPVEDGHGAFAYIFEGEGYFHPVEEGPAKGSGEEPTPAEGRPSKLEEGSLVLLGKRGSVVLHAEARPVRFLLASGKPIGEPVAWRGPIVMNTQEELRTAFREYQEGTFVKRRE